VATEEARTQLRRRLVEEYGMDETDLLLDRPPGGWDDLVTKDWLHLELGALETRMNARFAQTEQRLGTLERSFEKLEVKLDSKLDEIARELRSQTWRLVTVLVAGMGIAIGAAIGTARF
jgi:hypothetical protein